MAVTLIAHTEVGSGGATNIQFTSVPSTYDDLMLFVSLRIDQVGYAFSNSDHTFNNNTTTIYSEKFLQNLNGSISASRQTNQNRLLGVENGPGVLANTFSSGYLYIPNYKNTTNNKPAIFDGVCENNNTGSFYIFLSAHQFRSTSAISSVKISASIGSFVQYSQATLYGITKA